MFLSKVLVLPRATIRKLNSVLTLDESGADYWGEGGKKKRGLRNGVEKGKRSEGRGKERRGKREGGFGERGKLDWERGKED